MTRGHRHSRSVTSQPAPAFPQAGPQRADHGHRGAWDRRQARVMPRPQAADTARRPCGLVSRLRPTAHPCGLVSRLRPTAHPCGLVSLRSAPTAHPGRRRSRLPSIHRPGIEGAPRDCETRPATVPRPAPVQRPSSARPRPVQRPCNAVLRRPTTAPARGACVPCPHDRASVTRIGRLSRDRARRGRGRPVMVGLAAPAAGSRRIPAQSGGAPVHRHLLGRLTQR